MKHQTHGKTLHCIFAPKSTNPSSSNNGCVLHCSSRTWQVPDNALEASWGLFTSIQCTQSSVIEQKCLRKLDFFDRKYPKIVKSVVLLDNVCITGISPVRGPDTSPDSGLSFRAFISISSTHGPKIQPTMMRASQPRGTATKALEVFSVLQQI